VALVSGQQVAQSTLGLQPSQHSELSVGERSAWWATSRKTGARSLAFAQTAEPSDSALISETTTTGPKTKYRTLGVRRAEMREELDMPSDHLKVYFGMVDFSEPTLLILGEPSGLQWLAKLLESRWTGSLSAFSPPIELMQDIRIHVGFPEDEFGAEWRGSDLLWNISSADADTFADQLLKLADHEGPAHTYLDPKSGQKGIQVVASKGEYDHARVFSE
jgi:hypothetical protein